MQELHIETGVSSVCARGRLLLQYYKEKIPGGDITSPANCVEISSSNTNIRCHGPAHSACCTITRRVSTQQRTNTGLITLTVRNKAAVTKTQYHFCWVVGCILKGSTVEQRCRWFVFSVSVNILWGIFDLQLSILTFHTCKTNANGTCLGCVDGA